MDEQDYYPTDRIEPLTIEEKAARRRREVEDRIIAEAVRRLPAGYLISHYHSADRWALREWTTAGQARTVWHAASLPALAAMILADERFAPVGRSPSGCAASHIWTGRRGGPAEGTSGGGWGFLWDGYPCTPAN